MGEGKCHASLGDQQKLSQKQQQQQQQQLQKQQQQLHRPMFLSSRDVIPKAGGGGSKAGGSARDVKRVGGEQFEAVHELQQQQHSASALRGGVAADGDVPVVPQRSRSKVGARALLRTASVTHHPQC
jgi:hypothetical protein